MSGYFARGRLQDEEWLMRACEVLNRDWPSYMAPITADTVLNAVYTQQQAEFEELLKQVDPEEDIDPTVFPAIAYFNAGDGWPMDLIFSGLAAVLVWLFVPDYLGITRLALTSILALYVVMQVVKSRRTAEEARFRMRNLGLETTTKHPLTLRHLVRFRRKPVTVH
ncbi:hypothetical protein [Maricaulis sp.]|uniref:hypothetical protein n=1 Tax=Maricaulis sp. TaxID=1486257 RepID=UPI00262E909A|nr:hypothetical protein [Maricaulis sp.]